MTGSSESVVGDSVHISTSKDESNRDFIARHAFFQRGAIDSEIAWIRARGVKLKGYDNRYFAVSSGLAR
jgi:hypothetical protein